MEFKDIINYVEKNKDRYMKSMLATNQLIRDIGKAVQEHRKLKGEQGPKSILIHPDKMCLLAASNLHKIVNVKGMKEIEEPTIFGIPLEISDLVPEFTIDAKDKWAEDWGLFEIWARMSGRDFHHPLVMWTQIKRWHIQYLSEIKDLSFNFKRAVSERNSGS